jgi:hypothetical protein
VEVAGLTGFADLLQHITPQHALIHGIPKGSTPGDIFALQTAERYTGAPKTIARTLDCIDYPSGVRLMMFDYDPAPEAPETIASAGKLLARLTAIWPALTAVGWVATTSTSSAIRDKQTHDWLKPPEGMHVYVLATGDVTRFRELAKVRLWLAGTGYCKLATPNKHTGVASILERCLIDMTVFSPERLDYVAGAQIAKSAPFYQDRPAPELHPGCVLDLDSLPDVTADDRAQYATRVAEARARVAPEQRRIIRDHITTAASALPEAEVAQAITARITQAERGELDSDQPLSFDNGTSCTAGTLSKAFDGKRLRDPLEPDYGPSQAVFHWRGGDWRIVSWAHGVKRVYQRAQPALEPPMPDDGDMDDLLSRVPPAVRYRATSQGLVWEKPTKDGPTDVLLTNFTATIIAEITEDDGAETQTLLEVEAQRHGFTTRFTVSASQFHSMTWVIPRLGAHAIVFPGMTLKDHARTAIQLLSSHIDHRRVYTHLGWRKIGEDWCYLHAGGAIGPKGAISDVSVRPGEALALYYLPSPPEGETACAAIQASLRVLEVAPDAVTIPGYAAIWRAVLGNVDFGEHVAGPTGQGKTELAALLQQHWGAGMDARHLPAAWSSTGNALEGEAFLAKDAVMVVDDFCPTGAKTDIARQHREADRLLRAQGNRSGRQRMRADSTLRPQKPPRGLIVSTGEDIPRGHSLRARLLILDVTPGMIDWGKLTPCQEDAAAGVYAQALAGFVQWLAPRYGEMVQGLPAERRTLRQHCLHDGHRRTPDIVANLALGMWYFLAYAHDCGALTHEECCAYWERTWQALVDVATAQAEHHAGEEPVRRFLTLLAGAIAAGHAHVADARALGAPQKDAEYWGWREQTVGTGAHAREERQPLGSCIGWVHDTRLYLEPEAAFHIMQRFAEGQ